MADDAQGEALEVIWDAEIGAEVLRDGVWEGIGSNSADDPEVFGAYLKTVTWNSATAADRDCLMIADGGQPRLMSLLVAGRKRREDKSLRNPQLWPPCKC